MSTFGADDPVAVPARATMVRSQWSQTVRRVHTVTVRVYAFIYEVRPMQSATQAAAVQRRYCTVLALGASVQKAEAIAINCVHQHGWHILRTDTVTPLDATDVADLVDGRALLGELDRYGVSLRCLPAPIAA